MARQHSRRPALLVLVVAAALAGACGNTESDAERSEALEALRRATAPFHDVDTARAAGYSVQFTPCWYHADDGAMGYHFGNPEVIDGRVELLEPELLVYEPQADGSLRFVALEYIVPIPEWDADDPPELLGERFVRDETLDLYVLHVWLWHDNPNGLFAPWNPTVSCRHAAEAEDRAEH